MSARRILRSPRLRAAVCLCAAVSAFAAAAAPAEAGRYPSYNYDVWGQSVPVPETYAPEAVLTGKSLGIGDLDRPGDLYADGGDLYVLDSGNDRIVRIAGDLESVRAVLAAKDADGNPIDLEDGAGLFVDAEGRIRVALPEQGRILVLSPEGTLVRSYGAPTGTDVPENLIFKPVRIAVGRDGTQYAVCSGVYQGLVEMDAEGAFLGFFGSNHVDVTLKVLAEAFWRRIFSQRQKEGMLNIVPIEYSSIDLPPSGLIHAVTSESANSMYEIKKLDPKGNNILRVRPASSVPPGVVLNTGNYGDIESTYDEGVKVDTKFIDIAVDDDGFLFALDAQRGRVFEYDQESALLAVFGGLGLQVGTTREPVAVEALGDRTIVLDRAAGELTVYRPTAYGADIRAATLLYNQGLYEEAESLWRAVLRQSVNCDLAFVGIGKALFNRKDYAGAMRYFRLGYDKASYDEAWTEYRKDSVRRNFAWIFALLSLLVVALVVARRFRKPAAVGDAGSPGARLPIRHALLHPFKAFDEVRSDDRGTVGQAIGLMLAFYASRILSMATTAFLFNDTRLVDIRVGRELFLTAALLFAFVVSNWAASTWTGGEGRWRDILVSAGASLVPLVLANGLNAGLSWVLTLREGAFLSLIYTVALCWSGFVLVVSLMTVHRHSFGRALLTLVLTVAGMLFLLFLASLLYSLFQQFVMFLGNLFTELLYRI